METVLGLQISHHLGRGSSLSISYLQTRACSIAKCRWLSKVEDEVVCN